MRYIVIPEPVEVMMRGYCTACRSRRAEPESVTVRLDMLLEHLLDDPAWGKSPKLLRMSRKIEEAFEANKEGGVLVPGAVVALEDAHWEHLRRVVEDPAVGYNPVAMRQSVAFLDAILDAKAEPPNADPPPAA